MVNTFAPSNETTRSILVIEDEYDLRVLMSEALSAENWKVVFALTEEKIDAALKEVAGVILNWDFAVLLNRDLVIKKIGVLPLLVTTKDQSCPYPNAMKKPLAFAELINATKKIFVKDQFFVGDSVMSKITPDWGMGKVIRILPDQYYGVAFKSNEDAQSSEIALKCHFTGLKWVEG